MPDRSMISRPGIVVANSCFQWPYVSGFFHASPTRTTPVRSGTTARAAVSNCAGETLAKDCGRAGQEQRARLGQIGHEAVNHGCSGPDVVLAPLKEFPRRDADRDDDADRPVRVFGLEMADEALLVVRSRETG